MPIEKKYDLDEVLRAAEAFRKRITFEYVLIAGANDTDGDADALAKLARRLGALVNLLPLHPGGAPGSHADHLGTDPGFPRPAGAIKAWRRRCAEAAGSTSTRRAASSAPPRTAAARGRAARRFGFGRAHGGTGRHGLDAAVHRSRAPVNRCRPNRWRQSRRRRN